MKEKKLHLGCGKRYLPDFIHIDLMDLPHIDFKMDISDLSQFEDNSVNLVYCCHTFEYFDRDEAAVVLGEWLRVLKPNGILRLAVPDFEAIVRVYQKYGDLNHMGILGPLYGKIVINTPDNQFAKYHKTVYDFVSLKQLLESVGFSNVHRYNWSETIHKDYDDFSQAYVPHKDKESGILISLNVEAQK